MEDTIFSKIIRREIPAKIVYETENVLAFRDINPAAPEHVLVIPKRPIVNIATATAADREILGDVLLAAGEVARILGVADAYRIVINNGEQVGQSVFHLHVHVLAGRHFSWPPG